MAGFCKLLLAIDLSPASEALIERVIQMYPNELEKIHVVHVMKPSHRADALYAEPDFYDPETQRQVNFTTNRLLQLLQETGLGCAANKFYLVHGEPSFQIKRLAREIKADLVVVGSHTKSDDWMHLPGATTNCVIQGISSDVMAVKI